MRENQIIELGLKSKWLNHFERKNVLSRTDSRFANQIHNIVSQRELRKNLINTKLIIWYKRTEEFEITLKGLQFLSDVNAKIFAAKNAGYFTTESKNFEAIDNWLQEYAIQSDLKPRAVL